MDSIFEYLTNLNNWIRENKPNRPELIMDIVNKHAKLLCKYRIVRLVKNPNKVRIVYHENGIFSTVDADVCMLNCDGRRIIRCLLERQYKKQLKTQHYDTAK